MRDGYLIEWWSPPDGDADPVGRWAMATTPADARAKALALPSPGAWQGLVRIGLLRRGAMDSVVATDLAAVETWQPELKALPEPLADLLLPPRSQGETRLQVIAECGEALALAVRARLLSRRQVGRLLVSIDRSFEEHQPEALQAACSA